MKEHTYYDTMYKILFACFEKENEKKKMWNYVMNKVNSLVFFFFFDVSILDSVEISTNSDYYSIPTFDVYAYIFASLNYTAK
jgi:hypothetical protein